jgi:hypothetical protein
MLMNLPFSFLSVTAESTNTEARPVPLGRVVDPKSSALQTGPSFGEEVDQTVSSIGPLASQRPVPISVIGADGVKIRQVLANEQIENEVMVALALSFDGSFEGDIDQTPVLPLAVPRPSQTMEVARSKANDPLSGNGTIAADLVLVVSTQHGDIATGNVPDLIMRSAVAGALPPGLAFNKPQSSGGLQGETIAAKPSAGGSELLVQLPHGEAPVKAAVGQAEADHFVQNSVRLAPAKTHPGVPPEMKPNGAFSAGPADQTDATMSDPNGKTGQNNPKMAPRQGQLTEQSLRPVTQPEEKRKSSTAELTSQLRAPFKHEGPKPPEFPQQAQVNTPQETVPKQSLPSPISKVDAPAVLLPPPSATQPPISVPPIDAREDTNIQPPQRALPGQAALPVPSAPSLPLPPLKADPVITMRDIPRSSVSNGLPEAGALAFEGMSASVSTSPHAQAALGPMTPTTALMQVRFATEQLALVSGEDTSLLAIEGERRSESAPQTLAPHRTTASPYAAPTLTAQIRDAIGSSGVTQRSIEIALKPEELGTVRMTLTPSESGGSIAILVERPETLELVQRHLEALRRELRDAGWAHAELSVSQDNAAGDETNPDGDAASHGQTERGAFAPAVHEAPKIPSSHPPPPATSGLDLRI